jgi:hypothetical protein
LGEQLELPVVRAEIRYCGGEETTRRGEALNVAHGVDVVEGKERD